ncbi:PilZ domain-containing protein [bacterium]|nr:PilZ domain-containing protein [bacterium]
MSLYRKVLKWIPRPFREPLIRQMLQIRPFKDSEGYQVEIAKSRSDLEAAYRLLHECYVSMGIMDQHPSGLRCNLFSTLPYMTTIVAKKNGVVVGTVSVIKDSHIGLPSDSEYQKENDVLRNAGHRMIEVSCLAVAKEHRENHRISLHLMKYLYEYSYKNMKGDLLCATVHPRAFDFYSALLGFFRSGKVVEYPSVKGALAIHIALDLEVANRILKRVYEGYPTTKNLYAFMTSPIKTMLYPPAVNASVNPVMTPDLLKYFFVEKTALFRELNSEQRALVKSAYSLNFDLNDIKELDSSPDTRNSPFRFPMATPAAILTQDQIVFGKMQNLSLGGLYFETNEKLHNDKSLVVIFSIAGQPFRIPCEVRWRSDQPANGNQKGMGLEFMRADPRIRKILRQLHSVHNGDSQVVELKPVPKAA